MFEGQDIRNKRKKEGLSVVQLAERLNVSKDNLYKWETGKRPQSGEDYNKIESWLGKKLEDVPAPTLYDSKESVLRMLDKSLDANARHAAANEKNADSLTKLVQILGLQFNSTETVSTSVSSGKKNVVTPPHEEHKEAFLGKSKIRLPSRKKVLKKDTSD